MNFTKILEHFFTGHLRATVSENTNDVLAVFKINNEGTKATGAFINNFEYSMQHIRHTNLLVLFINLKMDEGNLWGGSRNAN